MAFTITQRPEQSIYGIDSDWNAVGNPVIYKGTTNQYTQTGYYLEVYVYNGATDAVINSEPFTFTPDTVGNITINISAILRSFLTPDNSIDLSNTNVEIYNDSNAYLKFYIKTKEYWSGSNNSQVSDGGNQFFAVIGSRQIPSTYGGNLFEYTAFNTVDYSDAKFLTRLEKPVWWRGWPFVLSAIIDDSLSVSLDLKVSGDSIQYAGEQSGNAGRLVGCHFGFVGTGVIDGSTEAVVRIVDFATKNIVYTELLTVELRDACANPVYLMARNSLGGVLQWMFDVDQEYEFDYGNGIKNKRLILRTGGLTINQWEALQDFITLGEVYKNNVTEFTSSVIKTSSRIGQQVYVVTQAGVKTGVIVIPTRNKTRTRRNVHDFEIEIEYPDEFAV